VKIYFPPEIPEELLKEPDNLICLEVILTNHKFFISEFFPYQLLLVFSLILEFLINVYKSLAPFLINFWSNYVKL
jgi:hypothetical protein